MNTSFNLIVLADNTVAAHNTQGEHGLAFWIETREKCLLFDTGQGLVLASNAHESDVDLDAVDAVVLSHGHYDHTGGLAGVLRKAAGPVSVHAHPDAILSKFQRTGRDVREIGMPPEGRLCLQTERCQLALSRQPVVVSPGIRTTGEIPRLHPEEINAEPFYREPMGREPDPFLDDQALFLDSSRGIVVLLGCAHAGVINTLERVRQLTKGRPLYALLGGMHLGSATEARIDWTCRELRRFNLKLMVPMHCTGPHAMAMLGSALPDVYQPGGVGTVFDF